MITHQQYLAAWAVLRAYKNRNRQFRDILLDLPVSLDEMLEYAQCPVTPPAEPLPVWRDLLPGEKVKPGQRCRAKKHPGEWVTLESNFGIENQCEFNEYQTTDPLPQKIPLTAADVPPGSVFRMPGMPEHCWMAPLEVYRPGLVFHHDKDIPEHIRWPSWQRLMETGCEIKRLTDKEFQPCWKFKV